VVATAHGDGVRAVQEAGADEVVDTDTTELSSIEPGDLALDMVGADPTDPVTLAREGGRAIGLAGAPDTEAAAARGVDASSQYTQVTTAHLDQLRELVDSGVVRPRVAATYSLAQIGEALAHKMGGGVRGKVAINPR
jgi:NADPH:quinone reductase-like Zn-dependent oxidoreductase